MTVRTFGKTAIAIISLCVTPFVYPLSGNPNEHFKCDSPEYFSRFQKTQCKVRNQAYIPPSANWEYPVAFIAPQAPGPHRVKIKLSGYNARPYAFCTGLDFASTDYIVIKPCAAHYPDLAMHTVDGVRPHGWWGWYRGPSNSMRLGLSLTKTWVDMDADFNPGFELEGTSYGGTGAILQSMMLQQVDPWWGKKLSVVRADIPHTKFTKNWLDSKPVNVAWEGYDRDGADIETQMANGSLDHIYYRVNGSPSDTAVIFDTEFFRDCDTYRIACFGTWHNAGHNLQEQGIALPFLDLYAGEDMDVRLDRMLPVFTNSSANHWGELRGHYNLGLSWNQGSDFLDLPGKVVVPIRYKAHRNIGGDIPDQPEIATFDMTIRRIENFPTAIGSKVRWQLHGRSSGVATVSRAGEVTITGLSLPDSDAYARLTLTHSDSTSDNTGPNAEQPSDNDDSSTGQQDTPVQSDTEIVDAETPVYYSTAGGQAITDVQPDPNTPGSPQVPEVPEVPEVPQPDPEPEAQGIFDGIVYTRQPRARTPIPGSSVTDASNWQHVSDVGRINRGIAEADVVIDDLQGNQRVIHNCTRSPEICVAQEARVSPNGKKIAYSVGYGQQLTEVRFGRLLLGIHDIPALTHAKLFIYDIASGISEPVPGHPANAIDRQPEWIDNDTLVFSSNRGNVFPHKSQYSQHRGTYADGRKRWTNAAYGVSQYYGYGNAGKSMQIWTMNIDGSNARNISPHETMALSPMVMTNGDILYSCWNGHGNEAFDSKFRATNNPGTEINKWWLCQVDGNGAGGHVVLNGHHSPILKTRDWLAPDVVGGEGSSELRAIRSVAEIRKDYLAVSNYYRANHTGSMGIIYGWSYKGPGVEGVSILDNYEHRLFKGETEGSGSYIPSDFIALTPYGNDQDTNVRRNGEGKAMGKAGYASALPGTDDFMITHARGNCYEAAQENTANLDWTGGEPLCQKGVYRVHVDQVTDPFDPQQMTLLAGGDAWQVYDADAITNYQSLWNQPAPERPAPLQGDSCYLQVVDARAAELQPVSAYDWNHTLSKQCSSQGCAVNSENKSFHAEQMKYLTVYEVEMWDMTYSNGNQATFGETTNNHGFKRVGVWGYQALEDDGSVRMQVPCETPLQILGQDENTMTIAHDDKLHSLRRGETRTCHGCHDGHSEERAAEIGESPELRFARTLAAVSDHPAPNNGFRTTWDDVESIIVNRCSGCHADMNNADGLLDSRITWDFEQLDWAWLSRQPVGNGTFKLPRPYTSKWVGKLARNSLLYWKCMGERMDGRTDAQYPTDIDFGSAHPTDATPAECRAIGNWIDQGIQRDPG